MSEGRDVRLRRFHQARWDEPVIFELSNRGERGHLVPETEAEIEAVVGDGVSALSPHMRRKEKVGLPEMAESRVLRHYLRLSQGTLGADLNVDIGQGTCTMKYSPKINERFATSANLTELHPLQDESTVQGVLEIMHRLDLCLREISGMDQFSLQPGGGSQAIFGMVSIIEAYHRACGQAGDRDEIITTIFSHPSNPAAAALKGYKVITLYPDEDGYPDLEALKEAVSGRTAGLLITNPEDTGIFNHRIREFTEVVHEAGGLCGYDQANANGILGITRAREAGFDLSFFNLHKTFSSPHGCGGPGAGALGVREELARFLPVPLVRSDGDRYFLDYDLPDSIGKLRGFCGVIPALVRSYAWIRSLGEEGLREVARCAVLSNNYLLRRVEQIRGAGAPYAPGQHRVEQVRYSWEELTRETGVTVGDIQRRMCDFGFHLWSSHHPWIVPEPFTLEPTESYSVRELDEYLAALERVAGEAHEDPELVRSAPHNSVVHRTEQGSLDDPDRWAVTWRAYLRKRAEREADRRP
ncbi:MAG: aminomethyl-transferring glycine dehydrogenase subunit GcvPB [Bacillota bacterium]